MSEIRYGKVITESFHDGELVSTKQELIEKVFSTRESLLKDTIDALMVINTGKTRMLTIEVKIDSKGHYLLTKRWRA